MTDHVFSRQPRDLSPSAFRRSPLRPRLLASTAAIALALAATAAQANPTGGSVVAGNANIVTVTPGSLRIDQSSASAILNWQSFSIGAAERVDFNQSSVNSVTLNRVIGADPSRIFGTLTSKGTVILVNPAGVFFGRGSHVDVGGLVATTSNISDQNFMAGSYRFDQASSNPDARVVNRGDISIRDTGLAALVAPSVANSGVIHAKLGRVALGGAQTFTLDFQGDGLLSFDASSAVAALPKDKNGNPVGALVSNTGQIVAEGGTVQLSARAVKGIIDNVINTDGVIQATSVGSQGGKIVLGGEGGGVRIGGTLDATGDKGGQIAASGTNVSVVAGATLDASGKTGGGSIVLGGETTDSVSLAAGATLAADATQQGSGGSVALLSKKRTTFAGKITARGGAQGGDGGNAEVSSHDQVSLTGAVDLTAARGKVGTFLIDPATIEITDNASSVNTGTTVSRGFLEAQAGNANITLSATGLITVDAMAGNLINLATASGNTFTLQSTQSSGIVFQNAATEIRTAGGNISLQAFGIGSTISNVGKLTSSGGAITLQATNGISLGNAINAGAGAISIQSIVGAISNKAGGSGAPLTGGAISLLAAGADIGATGAAINTATTNLTLETGGNLIVANTGVLTDLSVTAAHILPNPSNTYQVSSTGLVFHVADGKSFGITNIAQTGLNLSFTGDHDLAVGAINVGGGNLSVHSLLGNITGSGGPGLSGGALTLQADGTSFTNGAIGSESQAIVTHAQTITASTGSGGVFLDNGGSTKIASVTTSGEAQISVSGIMTVGAISASSATLVSTGSLSDDGNAATRIEVGTLSLKGSSIGSSATPLVTTASDINANAVDGGVFLTMTSGGSLTSIVAGNGAIAITSNGTTIAQDVKSTTSAKANSIGITVNDGDLFLGTIDAGASGDVTLTTQGPNAGSIQTFTGDITGNVVTLTTRTDNFAGVFVSTKANTLNITTGQSGISVNQTGAVTLGTLTFGGNSSSIFVQSSGGAMTIGTVDAGPNGFVSLNVSGGAILDDGSTSTAITASNMEFVTSGSFGTKSAHIQTNGQSLTLTANGDIFLDNAQPLSGLTITNTHPTAGVPNTLEVTSPFLTFDVTDDGSRYLMSSIVGTTLGTLNFSGDQTIVAGRVQTQGGSVNLQATKGDFLDDGDAQTRITGGNITIGAAGKIGTSTAPVAVDTSSLNLTTGGDLFVSDIADISSLSISTSHQSESINNSYVLTAPSLVFNVTDSSSGYALNTVTDITSLNFNFSGDRNFTLGTIELTRSGNLTLTTSGSILDDAIVSTSALAGSMSLISSGSLGTSANPLSMITGFVFGSATDGIFITVPMPTNSSTNTISVQLGSENGGITFNALQGDVLIQGISAAQGVTLNAAAGSIVNRGNVISLSSGTLSLSAAGGIGASDSPLFVSGSPTIDATASNGGIFITGFNDFSVATINAGTKAVALASFGSILDDGTAGTVITGSSVSLQGATLGTAASPLVVTTPVLAAQSDGTFNITDTVSVTTLSLTSNNFSSDSTFQVTATNLTAFTLSDDGSQFYIENVASSTILAFSLSSGHSIKIGSIDTKGGSASVTANSGDILNDGVAATNIAATTVSLNATGGSIGATGNGGSLTLSGASSLTAAFLTDIFVSDSAALSTLSLTVGSTAATASQFAITTASGQTIAITDDGAFHQSLTTVSGGGLQNFSFSTTKNILVGSIAASGGVSLSTSGGGTKGNAITMASSGSPTGIAAGSVSLSALNNFTNANLSTIGTSGSHLTVSTPSLAATGTADIFIDDGQTLSSLALDVRHNVSTSSGSNDFTHTYTYSVGGGSSGLSSFSVTDNGTSTTLSSIASSALDFSFTADRALLLGTISVGSTGSVALTTNANFHSPNNSFGNPSIEGADSSNRITAGSVSLTANHFQGDIGGSTAINVTTPRLAVNTVGTISVADNAALTALDITANVSNQGNSASYSISATNVATNITTDNFNGLFVHSINTSSGSIALTVTSNRTITLDSITTGSGGSATLTSSGTIQGQNGSSKITTDALTLNAGGSVGVQFSSAPLLIQANSLAGKLGNSLHVSNGGNLTIHSIASGGNVDITLTNNANFLSDGASAMTSPNINLTTTGGSIGTSVAPLLVDTQNLVTSTGQDLFVTSLSDLFSLRITDNHATVRQNTIQVTAPHLVFNVTDNVGGTQIDIANVNDASGLDFAFSSDASLKLGTLIAQAGRNIEIGSSGSITNNGSVQLTAEQITLASGGTIGTTISHIQTTALALSLTARGDIQVNNSLDLSTLSLNNIQGGSGTAAYTVTSGAAFGGKGATLVFTANDDGARLNLVTVTDSTGINFTATTSTHDISVGTINASTSTPLQASGTVTLQATGGDILAASGANRITAASANFITNTGGAIGAGSEALNLSIPKLSLQITGDVRLNSDTHIDSLSILSTHPAGTGTYSVVSPDLTFTATDDGGGTTLSNITDTKGLTFSFDSDHAITVGTIDLSTTGTASLRARGGGTGITGGKANSITAASLNLTSDSGAITGLTAEVNTISVNAPNGAVSIELTGPTSIGGITAGGAIAIDDSTGGDISLGSINAQGNSVTIQAESGSILSGNIFNTTTVNLTAAGSIGNVFGLQLSVLGNGTTKLTASAATNSRGAVGSITINESSNLNANAVQGPGAITLSAGNGGLSVGSVQSIGGASAVTLSANNGDILGNDANNSIVGSSVSLSANRNFGSGFSVGAVGTAINVTTPVLSINANQNIVVSDTVALTSLTINRPTTSFTSGGTIQISATGLTATITDSSSLTTITNLSSSGLAFTWRGYHSIAVGTIDTGSNGNVVLAASPFNANGSITAVNSSSLITTGNLSLTASSFNNNNPLSSIGTSGQFLPVAVTSIQASSGLGGIFITQAGSITLTSLSTGGALSVSTTSGGDITVGTLNYGNGQALTLNAAGAILSGGGQINGGSPNGQTFGAISLTAVNGIGTSASPLALAAFGNGTKGNTVSATVTGAGDIFLNNLTDLPGGLTTSAANGRTTVTSNGNILLSSMTSSTDASGKGITVVATSGNISFGTLTAGANFGNISLTASTGQILSKLTSSTINAFQIRLIGAGGVGDATNGLNAVGQRVDVLSQNGAIVLTPQAASSLALLTTGGGDITITAAADAYIGNALSNGGAITISAGSHNVVAGNINADTGDVTITAATIVDDGVALTRIAGSALTLTTSGGIGASSGQPVQTNTASLTATVSGTGSLFVDDANEAGLTLADISTKNGAIAITSAGHINATKVVSSTDSAGNGITLTAASGDLSVETVTAGSTTATVALKATAGSILALGGGTNITAKNVSLVAGENIGALTDFATLAGTPVIFAASNVTQLQASSAGAIINVKSAGGFTLGSSAVQIGTGGTLVAQAVGNLDASGIGTPPSDVNVALLSGGTLTLPSAAIVSAADYNLVGATDVVLSGGSHSLDVTASSLRFRSGASTNVSLTTKVGALDVALTGSSAANLTVSNTGALSNLSLATVDGGVTMTNSVGFTANSVTAGGGSRTASLTATTGDLSVGTVSAGGTGIVSLTSKAGSILNADSITADTLNLTSFNGIGSVGTPFTVTVAKMSAAVTGTGGIALSATAPVTFSSLATKDGGISVNSTSTVVADAITAGGTGAVSLTAPTVTLRGDVTAGSVLISGAFKALISGGVTVDTSANNGEIHVTGATDGQGSNLTLKAGAGAVILDGAATNLSTLSIVAGSATLSGVSTTGAQTYDTPLTLTGTYAISGSGNAFTANKAVTLSGATQVTTTNGGVTFADAVDGGRDLTVSSGSGNVTFSGILGGTTRLGALVVNSSGATTFSGAVTAGSVTTDALGTLALNGGSVDTTGAQSFGDAATLGTDTVLTTADGAVTFGGTLNGSKNLTISTGTGDIAFEAAVGGTALGNMFLISSGTTTFSASVTAASITTGSLVDGTLTVHGGSIVLISSGPNLLLELGNSVSILISDISSEGPATGTISINGGSIATSGNQSFAQHVIVGANAILTAGNVGLGGGLDAASAGGQSLSVIGNATFANVGANSSLSSLQVSGTSAFNGTAITTTGGQTYSGNVVLAQGNVLSTSGGAVLFSGTINSGGNLITLNGEPSNPRALTINAVSGNVTFGGIVGGTARLGDIAVNTSGATTFSAAVKAASVTTDAPGTVALNGGSVNTTGSQTYGEAVTLGANTTITATTVNFQNAVNSVSEGGAKSLSVVGNAILGGAIGLSNPLSSLSVSGTSTLKGSTIKTTGVQTYTGAVTLGSNMTLVGNTVTFLGGGDAAGGEGNQSLAITGNASFTGDFGASKAIQTVSVSGATTFNGGTIKTSGDQTYNGAMTLSSAQTLTSISGDLHLVNTVDSSKASALTLNAGGSIEVTGTIGGDGKLGAINFQSGGDTFMRTVKAVSLAGTSGDRILMVNDVTLDGSAGIQFSAVTGIIFDGPVTVSAGAINLNVTDAEGGVSFGDTANIKAATGFTVTGGSGVSLPKKTEVTNGSIKFDSVAFLPSIHGQVVEVEIKSNGDIDMPGLRGDNIALTLNAGPGALLIGRNNTKADEKINVTSLTVPAGGAGRADMFGSIGGVDGPAAALVIDSPLRGAPYFINFTPWGPPTDVPFDAINAPHVPVPTSPGASDLFTGEAGHEGIGPNPLEAYGSHEVLAGGNIGGLGASGSSSTLSTSNAIVNTGDGGAGVNTNAGGGQAGGSANGGSGGTGQSGAGTTEQNEPQNQ